MKLEFRYEKATAPAGANIRCEIDGNCKECILALGALIQHVHQATPENLRPIFREFMRALVLEDSPIWENYPDGTIIVDASAMKKSLEGRE